MKNKLLCLNPEQEVAHRAKVENDVAKILRKYNKGIINYEDMIHEVSILSGAEQNRLYILKEINHHRNCIDKYFKMMESHQAKIDKLEEEF